MTYNNLTKLAKKTLNPKDLLVMAGLTLPMAYLAGKSIQDFKKKKGKRVNVAKDPLYSEDATLNRIMLNHRRLDHLSPMQRYDAYNKTLSILSPADQKKFNEMYASRHGRLPTKRRALSEEEEIKKLEGLAKVANRVNPLNMWKQQYINDLGKELNPINAKMTALQKQVHARMNKEHAGAKPLTDFDRDRMLFDESNPRFAKERGNYLALQKQMQAAHQNVTKRYNIFK